MEIGGPSQMVGSCKTVTPAQRRVYRVEIGWQVILDDVVQKTLKGTKPMYIHEKTTDGMFVSRVRFWLPTGNRRNDFIELVVPGIPCSSSTEAEGHAAWSALSRFESGSFGMNIMDMSRFACDEMKTNCKIQVVLVGELKHGIRILLDEWGSVIEEIEYAYEPLRSELIQDMCNSTDPVYREIKYDVAQKLFRVKLANAEFLKEAVVRYEKAKRTVNEEIELISRYLQDRIIHRACEKKGEFPEKIKINMKIVLDELIKSLGWNKPVFTLKPGKDHCHVCQVDFVARSCDGTSVETKNTICGDQKLWKNDAIESAAMAVLSFLEKEMSIQLSDVSYIERSHAELYSFKAEALVNLLSSIGTSVLAKWEAMVNELKGIDYYCRKMATDHPIKEPCNWLNNLKCDLADMVAHLYAQCEFRLSLGKRRYKHATDLVKLL